MKDLRKAIRAFLLADSTVSTLVGATRIYPGTLPQGVAQTSVVPAVVQNLITESSDYHMQGDSGLGQARVQLDCWAQTQDEAVELANLVFDRLSGASGTIEFGMNSPLENVAVQGVFHDQGRDDYDSVAKLYTRRRDFLIWYEAD